MLKNLTSKSEAMSALQVEPASKKARHSSLDILSELYRVLSPLPDRAPEGGVVEVEVRVGMMIESQRRLHPQHNQPVGCLTYFPQQGTAREYDEFKSGIDEELVDRLKRSLLHEHFKETKQPLQVLHMDGTGNRFELRDNRVVHTPEKKTRFARVDFALLAHAYDIRIDAAVEAPIDEKVIKIDANKWLTKRIKKRSTFKLDNRFMWKVDLTEVETVANPSLPREQRGSEIKEVELEFELEVEAYCAWKALGDRATMTDTMAKQLLWLLGVCLPSNMNIPDTARFVGCDKEAAVVAQVQELTRRISSKDGWTNQHADFLGAMPVNISRRNLQHIAKTEYFVTEKSDGTRKLLYVVNDAGGSPIAVVCDRAKSIERLEGSGLIGTALRQGTVLDGELVFNLSKGVFIFLVFDVLCDSGEVVTQRPFRERLLILTKDVLPRCRHLQQIGPSCTPIVGKSFFDKRRVAELLARIQLQGGHRVYLDRDASSGGMRHHRTDGLIFQPDAPYCLRTDVNLIKWKYADLMTVDLLVGEERSGELQLLAAGPESVLIDCKNKSNFGTFSGLRLRADLQHLKTADAKRPRIAEVAYDACVGVWVYFHFREDKVVPNQMATVLGVLMEQAESVGIEELEYRLLARNEAENDFANQMGSMKNKALEFQRKRTSS
jgi:hypothetical protein